MRKITSFFMLLLVTLVISISTYAQDDKYLPSNTTNNVIHYNNFVLSFNLNLHDAEWVCYQLTEQELSKAADRSSCTFKQDYNVKGSSNPSDYTRSGYDKGHMTPAADVSFSLDAECECFNMPNIEPQTPQLNRITWEHLEAHVRDWVKSHHRPLYIICGGVLTHIDKTIGKDKVAVPDLFYKIIYDEATNNCVAFLIPNNNPDQNFYIYATNVKNIESSTGLKFFINLPKVKHDFVVNEVNINWFK